MLSSRFDKMLAAVEDSNAEELPLLMTQDYKPLSKHEWSQLVLLAIVKLENCLLFYAKEKEVFITLLKLVIEDSNLLNDQEQSVNPDILYLFRGNRTICLNKKALESSLKILVSDKFNMIDMLTDIEHHGVNLLEYFSSSLQENSHELLATYVINKVKKMPIDSISTWTIILNQSFIKLDALLESLGVSNQKLCKLSVSLNNNLPHKVPFFMFILGCAPDMGDFHYHAFLKIVEDMLNNGVDACQRSLLGRSALEVYLNREGIIKCLPSPEICRLLVKRNANPNELGENGNPVFHALFDNSLTKNADWLRCLKVMIEDGHADVSLCDSSGKNACAIVREITFTSNAENHGYKHNWQERNKKEVYKLEVMDYLDKKMKAKMLRTFTFASNLFAQQNSCPRIPKEVMKIIAGHVYRKTN